MTYLEIQRTGRMCCEQLRSLVPKYGTNLYRGPGPREQGSDQLTGLTNLCSQDHVKLIVHLTTGYRLTIGNYSIG